MNPPGLRARGMARRRSARLQLHIPVLVHGTDKHGDPFECVGATVTVSKHGARVLLQKACGLQHGMVLRLQVRTSSAEERRARVVWLSRNKPGELGIELQFPDNFWGVYFPGDGREQAAVEPEGVWDEPEPRKRPAAMPAVTPMPQPRPEPKLQPIAVDFADEGVQVLVTGFSACHSAFQEHTTLLPTAVEEGKVMLDTVVDEACVLRVIWEDGTTAVGRAKKVLRDKKGRWKVWLKFNRPILPVN